MNRKIFFAILSVLFVVFFLFEVFGEGQFFRIRGYFIPNESWTGGHPGKVTFDIGETYSGFAAGIDQDGYLSGTFWFGNVGWAIFNHEVGGVERPRILCSEEVFRNTTLTCPVSGYAWSQNAGWIALSGAFIDGGS